MWLLWAEPVLDLLVTIRQLNLMMFTEKTCLTEKIEVGVTWRAKAPVGTKMNVFLKMR